VGDLSGSRYAIVGGGVSGLAAAWYLQQRGAETHIFERDGALGGRVGSGLLGTRRLTLGGKNIGRRYCRFRAFAHSHGEHPYEPFGISSSRVLDGRLLTFDSTARARTLRQLRGVPVRDLTRLGALALTARRGADARHLGQVSSRRLARHYRDRTVEQVFGPRLRELLLRSLTVRVSAAEPDEVPMANVLPYVGMIVDSYEQLRGGMDELVSAAGARSKVRLGTEARGLLRDRGAVRGLRLMAATGGSSAERFDGVVVATPADVAARLVQDSAPRLAARLGEVRYFPVAVVLAEYEQPVFEPAIRAIAFGAEKPLSNAGAYGVNDLNVVRYTFSGRVARPLVMADVDPEMLADMAERTLAPFANVNGNHRLAVAARRMSPGLCAYHRDQASLLGEVAAALRALPGLGLAGDYLRGCSIEACFSAAEDAVAAIPGAGR
jgi:oxygen-dependent protoporphyrinogen oxidase